MVSYIKSFFKYLFNYQSPEDYDAEMEEYLAEELMKLEYERLEEEFAENRYETEKDTENITACCFQRTGTIDYISKDGSYVLIDGMYYFDTTACSFRLNQNDKVVYLCYKNSEESLIVVRIIENQGEHWGEVDVDVNETSFELIEHVIIGEVDYRQDRFVIIKDSDLKFSLDKVSGTFVPIQGDMLEMTCKVQFDEENPMDISSNMVVEVMSFRPVRSKVISTVITKWTGEYGVCDKQIFFSKFLDITGGEAHVGAKVLIEAVESNQGACSWRAIKMDITEHAKTTQNNITLDDVENKSLEAEKSRNIEVTYPLKFENVQFHEKPQITLTITNKSSQQITMYKWMILSKKRDSQVNITPFLNSPRKLDPLQTFNLTITCHPKFYGKCKEHMIITFRGFKIERFIEINVLSDFISSNPNGNVNTLYQNKTNVMEVMQKIRSSNENSYIPGVKLTRSANFVSVRMGQYNIPEKVWSAVLDDSNGRTSNYDYMLNRLESYLPCLIQTLNINNYTDRWHTLLYLEEIQATINMRSFDMPSTYLIRSQEYLAIEIKRLSERRPSIIVGDKVLVKDLSDDQATSYEGYVHVIRGDQVLMKFHPQFHEIYRGTDVSVEFRFNRSSFRKSHHAINLAISALGPDVLFPSRIVTRPPQVPPEKLKTMKWFNESLNARQKAAVTNVLLGECRPMPYCIYGPPGTGKTVTVVETLLQILTLVPDSRILVATPSNSAANLITERLLQYRKLFSNSLVRLIAHYMVDSENIPDVIKPFCATLNVARENTSRPSHTVYGGMNMQVQSSYVARHRVTIGTCHCLGTLATMELPKGHFTHIIVDEAGQAIEPEIMIPMTFVNKETGQIVVAGDPMQLGPVVLSKYCIEYGMNESYLARMIETFPYQRDHDAFENGFNEKLVTQLTDNYRSVQEVLTLPSEMFYDASLVAKIDRNTPFILKIINSVMSEIYEMPNSPQTGGIFVYGVKGNNARAIDSPSWYNPEEAGTIAITMCQLYKQNITPDEVGIITPYIAQIRLLRRLFNNMGIPRPKIGTVEEFQGQERPLILISTVRSTVSYVAEDQKHFLGFLRSPKRLNVALTRAQAAVILFGDPHLLMTDPLWNKVIRHAVKEHKYMGCDLSIACNENEEPNAGNLE